MTWIASRFIPQIYACTCRRTNARHAISEPIVSATRFLGETEVAMTRELQLAAILCVTVGVLAASAQSPPQTSQPDPKACAPGERLEPPGRQQSPSDTTGQADNNPSER